MPQGGQRTLVRLAFHLHPICLGQLMAGIGNTGLKRAVVGQQQQPFGVGIEPSGRIDAGTIDDIGEATMRRRGRELADDAKGFVEQKQRGHGGTLFMTMGRSDDHHRIIAAARHADTAPASL